MIRKSGHRFSEKIMHNQLSKARLRFNQIPSRFSVGRWLASYGADDPAATPLRDPPATGEMIPPLLIENPRPRAANQYRTHMTPMIPIVAPATTSLG
jgi:hypothetical protein